MPKQIITNSVWLLVGKIASVLFNLLITIMIARSFGEDGFGEYSFLLAYMSIALVISTFGMDVYVVRAVAGQNEQSISTTVIGALIIQLALGILIILSTIVWSIFFGSQIESMEAFWLYLLIIIPSALGTVFNGILKGIEKMGYYVVYLLFDLAIQVIGIQFLLSKSPSIFGLILILLAARISAVVLAGFFVWITTSINWQLTLPTWKQLNKIFLAGSYISMAIILTTIFQRLGVLTLSFVSTDADVGLFNAANKLIEGIKIIPAVFYGALFPAMVKGGKYFQSEMKGVRYLFFAMLMVSLGGYLLSDIIIFSIFKGFGESNALFKVLILGVVPFMVRQFYAFRFIAAGREKEVFFTSLVTLVVALVVYNGAFHYFGLIGLCWAINLVLVIEILVYILLKNLFRINFR
jgi:O-antigen/teichoic acid export membrane protein